MTVYITVHFNTFNKLLKIILDPINKLPKFLVGNLSRLPSVSIEHVDVSALLQEVAYLRSEVRNFAMMFDELKSMRSAIDHLVASDIDRCQRKQNNAEIND